MRPVTLTFKGLRSYRRETTVDFRDLNLFAVIGDTGAGKSTIIEALSIVLYGTYTWGGGRLEDLICEGEKSLAITFTFTVDGEEWVVTRTRNRNSSPGVNKLVCAGRGERVDGSREVTARITELLGLDHSQFTRAVVLPQGRFDELLRASPSVRSGLLRSILGLGELSQTRKAVEELRDRWRPELLNLKAQRSLLSNDPQEALVAAEEAVTAARSHSAHLTRAAAEASAASAALAHASETATRLVEVRRAVPVLDGDLLAELEAVQARAVALQAAQDEAEAAQDSARAEQARLGDDLLAALEGFSHRDDVAQAKATVLSASGHIDDLRAELAAADARLTHFETQSRTEVAATAAARIELGTQVADLTTSDSRARDQLEQARHALERGRRAWQRLTDTARRVQDTAAQLTQLEASIDGHRAEVSRADERLSEVERDLEEARQQQRRAVRSHAAAAAASGCGPGDPCPVCTRHLPDDFHLVDQSGLAAADAAVAHGEGELQAARRTTQEAHSRLNRAEAELQGLARTASVERDELEMARHEAEDAGVAVSCLQEDEAVAALMQQVGRWAEAAENCATQLQQARARLTAVETEAHLLDRQHHDRRVALEGDAARVRRQLDALQHSLTDLPDGWVVGEVLDRAALEETAGRLTARLERLDRIAHARQVAENTRSAAETALSQLRAERVEQVTGPASRSLDRLVSYSQRVGDLRDALQQLGCEPAEEALPAPVVDDLAHPEQLEDLRRQASDVLTRARRTLEQAQVLAERVEDERAQARVQLDAALVGTGLGDVDALRQAAWQADVDLTQASDAAELAAQASQTAATLDARLSLLEPFVAQTEVLAGALRDGAFVTHLASLREAELLEEATRRLKAITGGRYGFVAGFSVSDLTSGEVRGPENLSGGERFQAALALALALVEIAARGSGRLEAIFVDEGFGSLDNSALSVALDTLATVAGGGKMVALISHLQTVAEYVDTVLHVTKHDLFGSSIRVLGGDERDALLGQGDSGLTA